jgi:hypothetical protein
VKCVFQKKQFTSILPIKKYWLRKAQTSPRTSTRNNAKILPLKILMLSKKTLKSKEHSRKFLNQQIVLPFTNLKKHYPEIYGKPLVVK